MRLKPDVYTVYSSLDTGQVRVALIRKQNYFSLASTANPPSAVETKSEPDPTGNHCSTPSVLPAGNGSFVLKRQMLSKDAETKTMQATMKPQNYTMNTSGFTPRNAGPEKKIRSGAISAAIWANEQDTPTGRVTFKTVSFERTYKDKDGKWQSTNKLRASDIPRAVLVLNKAYEYLALGEEIETSE